MGTVKGVYGDSYHKDPGVVSENPPSSGNTLYTELIECGV